MIAGVTCVNANRVAPGVINHAAGERLIFGEVAGGQSDRTERLRQGFEASGIVAEVHPDIQLAVWQKFVAISGSGPVTALTRLPIGPVLACPETRELLQQTVAEVVTVGRARGIRLDIDYAARVMELFAGYPPSTRPSMLEDLQAGRRLELETITGAALRMGRECGVPMSANSAIYAALKPYVDAPPTIPVPPT